VLRHTHLCSYVLGAVEFASADEQAAALVAVPPYHVAGVSNVVSNVYSTRRVVLLPRFDPADWLATARAESVSHALVVPTMLAQVVERLGGASSADVPSLRTLAYGGAPMPLPVLERALELFADVDFVNAYGLTETSSTIAVLGPDDHREALASDEPEVRGRLRSAGRMAPSVEAEIRSEDGAVADPGRQGLLWVRGEQVSGEYAGAGSPVDEDGWFPTGDLAHVDADGYLFIEGRADDTIIRGGENVAPAEIEDALRTHEAVADVAVVGVPDRAWGECIAAAVVPVPGAAVTEDELRDHVRSRLRGSKTPDQVRFRTELPYTDTGKLLRRRVRDELAG
jgi:acyl-CoA synthetase (AMP-forming)/AMP-acid ligase II